MQARTLRKKGWSIIAIAKELSISKSSSSIWCRDIILTNEQVHRLTRQAKRGIRIGQLKGAAANRRKKEAVIAAFRAAANEEFRVLTAREILLAGLGVYWGEGIKGKGTIAITNSDPKIILFMLHWFQTILEVSKEMFRPQVFINELHRPRERIVLKFWSILLDIPKDQFRKTVFIRAKHKKVYENHDSYYGILTLRVRKGTNLKYRVLGYLDALGAYTSPT